MKPVILSRRALREIDEIAAYIAKDAPMRAATFVQELLDRCDALGFTPEGYALRAALGPGVRVATFAPYLIAYSIEAQVIRILSIRHGARRAVRIR